MFTEFYLDNFYTDNEVKETLKKAKEIIKIDSVLINEHHYRLAKYFFSYDKINVFIDYPLGIGSSAIRLKSIESLSNKLKIISIQAPLYYLINRKYDKIRKEIKQIKEILGDDIEIRYFIDYRKYNHAILAKFCSILVENNILSIYPSTGFFIDNIYDNILASKYLEEKSKIKTIFNGNIWTHDHIDIIMKARPIGLSVQHHQSLYLIKEYLNKTHDAEK